MKVTAMITCDSNGRVELWPPGVTPTWNPGDNMRHEVGFFSADCDAVVLFEPRSFVRAGERLPSDIQRFGKCEIELDI